jgi:hypothetical protein
MVTGKAFSRRGFLLGFLPISLHNLLHASGDPRFRVFFPVRAPHCAFCILRCGLLFGLWSFPFSSFVPLPDVVPLFIYLFNLEKVDGMLQVTTSVG